MTNKNNQYYPISAPELLRRETSRRKAKENLKSKIEAQEKLLMDDHDPTLNNPALDLEDSDDDAEWNPVKEAEKSGKRKRGDSSDEEYNEFNNLHNSKLKNKRRAYLESNQTSSIQNRKQSSNSEMNTDTQVPDGQPFKVRYLYYQLFPSSYQTILQIGTFLILKSEESSRAASLWRVDGRSLIQKFSCCDEERRLYRCVNTYSGWTAATRHRYRTVSVRQTKSDHGDNIVQRIEEEEEEEDQTKSTEEIPTKSVAKPTSKKFNVE